MAKKTAKKATKKAAAKRTAGTKKATKKAAKKPAKKQPAKKTTKKKAAKKPAKKAANKKAAKKATKQPAKKKAAKKATPKKTAGGKKATKKAGSGQASADAPPAKGGKRRFAISLAPKGYKRRVAPGVAIEGAGEITPGQPRRTDEAGAGGRRLSSRELRKIHDLLIDKREQLLAEIRHQVGDSLTRNSEVKTDTADRAADVLDGDVSYEMAVAGHRELEEIEAALEKIAKKTYGSCEGCGCEISPSRLKVKPFASLCVQCREMAEKDGGLGDGESIWGFLDADAEDTSGS